MKPRAFFQLSAAIFKLVCLTVVLYLPTAFALSAGAQTGQISARDYLNPNTGRFWTSDSTDGDNEDPLSLHKYLYSQDNPVDGSDPSRNDDIGDLMVAMDIGAGLGALPGLSIAPMGAISSGSICGPDITVRLMKTLQNVKQTFDQKASTTAGKSEINKAAVYMFDHPFDFEATGWDIDKLVDLGVGAHTDFGNGSHLGTGIMGADTVQFAYNGLHVYKGGSVNYALWGEVMFLFSKYAYLGSTRYSEGNAVGFAQLHKELQGNFSDYYETEAIAFIKFGYERRDPSDTAMKELKTDPSNVADKNRFLWQFEGIHDTRQ